MALGDPQPGNRNDTIVYRTSGIDQKLAGRPVMADGAYRGNPDVIIPYRKPADGGELPDWKADLNRQHRTVRAQVEHALARMKTFTILRDYRRAAHTLTDTASVIAHLTTSSSPDDTQHRYQTTPPPSYETSFRNPGKVHEPTRALTA